MYQMFEEEVWVLHPVVQLEKVKANIEVLYGFHAAAKTYGVTLKRFPDTDKVSESGRNILRMIFAICVTMKNGHSNALSQGLAEPAHRYADRLMWRPADLGTIKLFTLMVSLLRRSSHLRFHLHRSLITIIINLISSLSLTNLKGYIQFPCRAGCAGLSIRRHRSTALSRVGSASSRSTKTSIPKGRRSVHCDLGVLVCLHP